jgi:hypothetical protein
MSKQTSHRLSSIQSVLRLCAYQSGEGFESRGHRIWWPLSQSLSTQRASVIRNELPTFISDCEPDINFSKAGDEGSPSTHRAVVGPIQSIITDVGTKLYAVNDETSIGNSTIFEPDGTAIFN